MSIKQKQPENLKSIFDRQSHFKDIFRASTFPARHPRLTVFRLTVRASPTAFPLEFRQYRRQSMPNDVLSANDGTAVGKPLATTINPTRKVRAQMTDVANNEQNHWNRVKGRLRTNVGEDVYTSWFARMDLERIQDDSVHLSVPTSFSRAGFRLIMLSAC